MPLRDRLLIGFYLTIAAIALPATWVHNLAFMAQPDNGGVLGFIAGGYATAAGASITNDLWAIATAAIVFMVVEGRRIGIRWLPVYVVLSFGVAVSVTFSVFLAVRHAKLVRVGANA
jgi:hypothetical protein